MKYKHDHPHQKSTLIYTTLIVGGCSLLLFYLFLFFGPFSPINFGMDYEQALAFDSFLCFLFFIEHSTLIRKGIRTKIEQRIGTEYFGSFYTISSGCILLLMILLWQKTYSIASAGGLATWTLRALFVLCVLGFYWGVKSLGSFDPFGIKRMKFSAIQRELKPDILIIKGPYLWVRHPLYLFSLLMIWLSPDLTADRLLFNLLWTFWIIIATKLEERDLLMDFGEKYQQYKAKVPMLIPYRLKSRIDRIS
jgi:methanethiol S-methyltransferase